MKQRLGQGASDETTDDVTEVIDGVVNDGGVDVPDLTNIEANEGVQALLTPEGVLSFSSGMVYGTGLVQNTYYLDICTQMLDVDFVQRGRNIYNTTQEFKVFASLYQLYDMAWHIHPLF